MKHDDRLLTDSAAGDPLVHAPSRHKVARLAALLAEARKDGRRLDPVPDALVPCNAEEADAVQDAAATLVGPVAAYKVAQVGDGPGSWGAICAAGVLPSPATAVGRADGIRIEIEVAFRLGRDLPGHVDGRPYAADEVFAAIDGAFAAFELIDSRLPREPKPSALLARADMMSNLGLVVGPITADWRAVLRGDAAVSLTIDGRPVVSQRGGHPSGDPVHPVVWLADALARRGHGLRAGQMVTTGSFGGSHPILPGETARGTVEGFGPITFGLSG